MYMYPNDDVLKLYCSSHMTHIPYRYAFTIQMVPLIKSSTDNLVAVIGEKAASEVTFEVMQ